MLGEYAYRDASGTTIAKRPVNDPLASPEPSYGKSIMKLLSILTP